MMKKSMILSVVLAFVTTLCSYAQLNVGMDSYYLGDYEKAEELIKKSMAENPEMANYYLGGIAFSKGDVSEAESFYNEGLRVNAESVFNRIGLLSVKLKSNAPGAERELTDVAKKNKKDVDVMLAIGRAYLQNGMAEQAMKQVDEAKKINNKKPEIYILEGDIVAAESKSEKGKGKGKAGEAAGKYEMAAYFSPDYLLAYMKVAQFYEHINPMLAIEKLRTVIEKQPEYSPAYGYLGKLYTQQGFYPEAIAAFSTYFKAGIYAVEDTERCARAYYFTDNYPEAAKLVEEGLGRNPKHFVLNRYKMYIADKTKNADQGMLTANYFFSLRSDTGYIAKDYSVFASILNQNKKYEDAFVQYNKAISQEPANLDLYSEAASRAREDKHYAIAASYLKKQMEEKSKLSENTGYQDDVVDISTLGYDYYTTGVSITKNESLAEKLMNNANQYLKN
ncbi:MAG: tetratricopeptide repeat protein [Tannerella sp.]|jgi:tetratricopeptide (TPR) repeat protein|nr:tetratricopeptide repeat protein [Tannerella sp.]